uniref:Secreted protein n=1 Tax=Salvator merianae TaxID=96440 RepID=A0A8D0BRS1_SALMN
MPYSSLLCFWLCFLLVASPGHGGKDRHRDAREAGMTSTLLGRDNYKRLQNQVRTVQALSRRYWHFLTCGLWQKDCEEYEEMPRCGHCCTFFLLARNGKCIFAVPKVAQFG